MRKGTAICFWLWFFIFPLACYAMFPLETMSKPGGNADLHQKAFHSFSKAQKFAAGHKRKSIDLSRIYFKPPKLSFTQKHALRQAFATIPAFEVHFDTNGRVTFLKGSPLFKPSASFANVQKKSPETIALAALNRFKALLNLSDPDKLFIPESTWQDKKGFYHVRLKQQYQGIPVFGKEFLVHLNHKQEVYLMEGHYVKIPENFSLTPSIEALEAVNRAVHDAGVDTSAVYLTKLVIYEDDGGLPRLAWQIELQKKGVTWRYFVDAQLGFIFKKYDLSYDLAVPGSGRDQQTGSLHQFSVWQENNRYFFIDTESLPFQSRNPSVAGQDFGEGNIVILFLPYGDPQYGIAWLDSYNPNQWPEEAVSVWYGLKETLSYYFQVHGRRGMDNQGSSAVGIIGLMQANAFYDGGQQDFMFFGTGDGYQMGSLTALDVVAHEFTHGVTNYSAKLEYQFQSGALNEAFSDIFAAMIDREDWLIGEDVVLIPPYCLRNLEDPHNSLQPQPATMDEYQDLPIDQDRGGVHINATIPAHTAYLIAQQIGRERAERIFYRTLTVHLTPQSDFWDFCRALSQSAEELFGASSNEQTAVIQACNQIGIAIGEPSGGGEGGEEGGEEGEEIPPEVPPAPGGDYLIFTFIQIDNGDLKYYLGEVTPNGEIYYVTERTIHPTRPAPYYQQPGYIFFIDENYNLWLANIVSETYEEYLVNDSGEIWSIATSPASSWLVYTSTSDEDNNLYLWHIDSEEIKVFPIAFQVPDAAAPITTFFPDVVTFGIDGQTIFFDCYNEIELAGKRYQFWALGRLDLVHGASSLLLPVPQKGYHIGNPAAAQSKPYLLAYDIWTDTTVETRILNLRSGRSGLAWWGLREKGQGTSGWPSFNGDDSLIYVQDYRPESAEVVISIPIVQTGDIWQGIASQAEDVLYDPEGLGILHPVVYRPGQRALTPVAKVSPNRLDFGRVRVGQTKTLTLNLQNIGDYPLEFRGSEVEGDKVFDTKAVHVSLDPGETYTIKVIFKPEENRFYRAILKIFTSDPEKVEIPIPLTGEGGTGEGGETTSGAKPLPQTQIIDLANPNTAPVKILSGHAEISFAYQGKVDILVGIFSEDFEQVFWLNSNCHFQEGFAMAVRQKETFQCQTQNLPLTRGYVFWLVSPKPLEELDWDHDPFELLFYPY